jgi:hypothetical protein
MLVADFRRVIRFVLGRYALAPEEVFAEAEAADD